MRQRDFLWADDIAATQLARYVAATRLDVFCRRFGPMASRTYGAFPIGYYCGRDYAAFLPLRGYIASLTACQLVSLSAQ